MTLTTDRVHFRFALHQFQMWRVEETGSARADEKATLLGFVDVMHARGKHSPSEITDDDVAVWWSHQQPLRPSTRSGRMAQVQAFLTHCRQQGWM